ncbi:hypothetical protein P692DRAFT_20326251 [Suillus brevipes Sb2]|nr:hypothetical protein P692DRAFT_20326251 [Suillus brevipes Sb2]
MRSLFLFFAALHALASCFTAATPFNIIDEKINSETTDHRGVSHCSCSVFPVDKISSRLKGTLLHSKETLAQPSFLLH